MQQIIVLAIDGVKCLVRRLNLLSHMHNSGSERVKETFASELKLEKVDYDWKLKVKKQESNFLKNLMILI